MGKVVRGVVAVLALGLGPAQARAQNLLANPDFDTDMAGWTVENATWSYLSTGGWPAGVFTPGAVVGSNVGTVAGGLIALSQCVPVAASTTYVVSAQTFVPTGQVGSGQAYVKVTLYTTSNCAAGTISSQVTTPAISTPGTSWQRSSATFTTEAVVHSARLGLVVQTPQANGTFDTRFDAVYLGRPVKGDLNGDGRVDLVLDDLSSDNHVAWFMAKERQAGSAALSPAADGPDWKLSAVDDFDTSSAAPALLRDDLVFRNTATGELQFWLMNGTARTSVAALSGGAPPPVEWQLTSAADFDHDGVADLLWRNTTTQKLMVWTMNGTAWTGVITPSPDHAVDSNWGVVAALDVDKDGNADLLWYNSTTGKIVIWYMDASVVRTTGKFATPANAGDNNWKVLAAGDYARVAAPNLDSVDLVWRNETSGKMVLWYLDTSFVRVSGGFTSPDSASPALGWTVAGPR